jgi:hypothetical protein
MAQNKLVRVAFVRFSPQGKSYPALCNRRDIVEGDQVAVLMSAESDRSYSMNGVIDYIELHRWHCTCRVECLVNEIEYSITKDGKLERNVDSPSPTVYEVAARNERKRAHYEARNEMQALYEAVAGEEGEDAYLGDGVWIRPDGSFDDRGACPA